MADSPGEREPRPSDELEDSVLQEVTGILSRVVRSTSDADSASPMARNDPTSPINDDDLRRRASSYKLVKRMSLGSSVGDPTSPKSPPPVQVREEGGGDKDEQSPPPQPRVRRPTRSAPRPPPGIVSSIDKVPAVETSAASNTPTQQQQQPQHGMDAILARIEFLAKQPLSSGILIERSDGSGGRILFDLTELDTGVRYHFSMRGAGDETLQVPLYRPEHVPGQIVINGNLFTF